MVEVAEPLPHAVIAFAHRSWSLRPGQTLTFGRGREQQLRIGHAPEDRHVSRSAGVLECRPDGVLVRNTSERHKIVVEALPGPSIDILPGGVTGTHPHLRARVVVLGRLTRYAIAVDARPLGSRPASGPGEPATGERASPTDRTVGYDRITDIRSRHRILLSALCLPLLTRTGDRAAVPTYTEMERILREHGHPITAKAVKNGLDELRFWLTYVHDVGGLLADEGAEKPNAPRNYLPRLAQWAILSGNVTDRDLDSLAVDRDRRPE